MTAHLSYRVLLTALMFPLGVTVNAQMPRVAHQDLSRYIDDSGNVRPIRTPQDWQQRRRSILEGFQQAAGELPLRKDLPALDLRIGVDEEFQGVRRVTGTILAEAGDRIPLDLYLPLELEGHGNSLTGPTSDMAVPGVLALHPTGAAGKRIVAGDKPNRQYAIELAQRGYVVVAPDYVSFGEYADYDFESDAYSSGTMKGIFNHMRCVDLLVELSAVDRDRIGVIGHSLGGHNAIFTAVFDQRIDVVVSSCGWTPFHYYYGGKLQGWTSSRYMPLIRTRYELNPDAVPFDFYELIAALAPRTFVSVSPINDSNFDVAGVRKAMPAARQIYELLGAEESITLFTPDCEHDFPTDMRHSTYEIIDLVLEFEPRALKLE
jgi:acetyl esterase/lipase